MENSKNIVYPYMPNSVEEIKKELVKYLPVPIIKYDGNKYYLEYNRPYSIGKVRKFYGVIAAVLRSYSWLMSIGERGLKEVAELSILNNNYLMKKFLSEVRGISAPWAKGKHRMEQVRYSWEKLKNDTGVGTDDINRRANDYGLQNYFQSHHPWIIDEPFTPEPNESYSKREIDEYAAIFKRISQEAYENPKLVKTAPHNAAISFIPTEEITDPKDLIVTWRGYKKRNKI